MRITPSLTVAVIGAGIVGLTAGAGNPAQRASGHYH